MKLSQKKQRFVELVAQGLSYEEAGKKLGISRATSWRWANDPAVKTKLGEIQNERLETLHRELLAVGSEAIQTLRNLFQARSEYVRAQSARHVLDLLLKVNETLQLEARLEALEEKIKRLEEINGGESPAG